MRKEWILTDEEKYLKREKIVRNRMIKQQGQVGLDQVTGGGGGGDVARSTDVSFSLVKTLFFICNSSAIFFFSTRTISYQSFSINVHVSSS